MEMDSVGEGVTDLLDIMPQYFCGKLIIRNLMLSDFNLELFTGLHCACGF